MAINNEISLVKFLKMYYNIPSGKVKYLRHKELKYLLPEIKTVSGVEFEILNKKVATGECLRIIDCEGVIMYYVNPFYKSNNVIPEMYDFEKNAEFINAPLYHRFKKYEGQNNQVVEETDSYEGPLEGIPRITNSEIETMEKWELMELKSTLEKYNKMTMGAYYVLISKIKQELSRRRKENIDERRAYQKKKETEKYD